MTVLLLLKWGEANVGAPGSAARTGREGSWPPPHGGPSSKEGWEQPTQAMLWPPETSWQPAASWGSSGCDLWSGGLAGRRRWHWGAHGRR